MLRVIGIAIFLPAVILLHTAVASAQTVSVTNPLNPYTPPLRSDLFTYRFVADADDAASLFVNPAGLGARRSFSSLLSGTYEYNRFVELTSAVSLPVLGLGHSYQRTDLYRSNTYLIGLGLEFLQNLYIGTSLRWHHTDLAENRSPFSTDVGFLMRPHRFLSLGGVWKNANEPRFMDGRLEDCFTGGISIRPMTERITISGQGAFADGERPGWLVGGRLSILPGIEFFGSYMRDLSMNGNDPYEEYTVGAAVTFGSVRMRSSARSRVEGNLDYNRDNFSIEKTRSFVKNSVFHKKKYAEITVSGNYLDEGGGFSLLGTAANDLHAALRELENIRRDDDVKGLLLKIGSLKGAFIGPVSANLNEIRNAVKRVVQEGKPVVAYLQVGATAAELYLASAADRVVAPRETIIGMIGVSLEIRRMKRLFAKLGVDWDYYTAGEYKSTFHTPYTDTTTAAQEEELVSMVGEAYRLLTEGIAEGRGITMEKMLELADGRIFSPDEAVEEHLVDVIGWEKEAREELGKLAGTSNPEVLKTTSIAKRTYWTERWKPAPVVAVVGAYGSINSGKSGRDPIRGGRRMGSMTVVNQLKAASAYPGVRAIVFRVDSGGGSALASDEILNEICHIQEQVKIPVVVSMGNVAGSGGYWISMYGNAIFADPFTITGSIGVVAAKPVLERLYEKIGITNEVFKAGKYADAMSTGRRMTEEEKELLSEHIDELYDFFIERVAEGRKMNPGRVREIAGGRVYLGTQALDINLIDSLGGMRDAIEHAASMAGIEGDYRTVYFRAFPGFFSNLAGKGRTLLGLGRALRALRPGGGSNFDETLYVF